MSDLNETLRQMVIDKGYTTYRIAKLSKIDYKGIYKFMHHDGNLHWPNMVKLMQALGYRVAMIKRGTVAASRIDAASMKKDEIIDIGKH